MKSKISQKQQLKNDVEFWRTEAEKWKNAKEKGEEGMRLAMYWIVDSQVSTNKDYEQQIKDLKAEIELYELNDVPKKLTKIEKESIKLAKNPKVMEAIKQPTNIPFDIKSKTKKMKKDQIRSVRKA